MISKPTEKTLEDKSFANYILASDSLTDQRIRFHKPSLHLQILTQHPPSPSHFKCWRISSSK